MGRITIKIIRNSIHTFLKNYDYFTNASLLSLPFSASILLSSSLLPDSILQNTIHFLLRSLFNVIEISVTSKFLSIFVLKTSQTLTTSVLLLPFSFSFLLITKTFIIQSLNTTHHKKPPSFTGIFNSILETQLWNSIIIISANATLFSIIFVAFNCLENFKISSATLNLLFSMVGGIMYSILIANSMIILNMALVLSGMETKGGFISILKACVIIRRRTSTALSLALCINIILTGIEMLFRIRVATAYVISRTSYPSLLMVLEGLFIAYLYSTIITIDTITCCIFYKSYKFAVSKNLLDQEVGKYGCCLDVKREEELN